jgi:hypothetical protein
MLLFLVYSGIAHGTYSCPDFNGQNIQEFCHVNDVQNLAKHFQEGKFLLINYIFITRL